MEHEGAGILVKVTVPDLKSQTRVVINKSDPVGYAKQAVLEKLAHGWPTDVSNNYGLYIHVPPSLGTSRQGKFLDETRPLSDYSLHGISGLELRYKKREYSSFSGTEKSLIKANTKSNQKKLVDYINGGSVRKMNKLLETGLDPNFIMDDGNTPLGVACGRNGHAECIRPLISDGGAHIDFKGSAGLTPLHRAAIGGNSEAVKILLSLGASPNYLDNKGLTPLYHASMIGDDISVCEALLKHRAYVGTVCNIGWSELHQIAKHGYDHLIDIMLIYGADINLQNQAGNTPLHVAAQHGQLRTALHLMKRGADKTIVNLSNQPPNQIAILCGQHKVAKEILDFKENTIEIIKSEPVYSSKARPYDGKHKQSIHKLHKGSSLTGIPTEISPSKQMPSLSYSPPVAKKVSARKAPPPPIVPIGSKRASKEAEEDNKDTPTSGHHYSKTRKAKNASPALTSSTSSTHTRSPSPSLRERLYPIPKGKKYVATSNIEPKQEGDLQLTKGEAIEVLYVGKGGFWEGRNEDGHQGWFPQNVLKEKTYDDDDEFVSQDTEQHEDIPPLDTNSRSGIKTVAIHRGEKGFGFAMRGIKAVNVAKFKPSPNVPALQYVARVDKNGAAENAGLEKGDFIIEVNGNNTTYSTHEEVVSIIKQAGDTLLIRVITPISKQEKSKDKKSSPSNKYVVKEKEQEETSTQIETNKASPKLPVNQNLSQDSDSDQMQRKTSVSSLTTVTHKMSPLLSRTNKTTNQSPSSSPVKTSTMKTSPVKTKKVTSDKSINHASNISKNLNNSPVVLTSHDLIPATEPAIKYEIATAKVEELIFKEQERYKEFMEEDDEQEPLSEFAKQLRKASKDHYKRSSMKDCTQTISYSDIIAGDFHSNNNDDDDGWEVTEALTSWNDINTNISSSSLINHNTSPKAHHVQTSSSPKAQHIQTNSSPKAQHIQTSSLPKAHHVQTSSSPKAHHVQTNSSPKAQHVQTSSSPKVHHVQTSSSPKVQHVQTSSSPKAHHVQTSSPPKAQHIQTNSSPKAHHVQTSSPPKAQHIQTNSSPKAHHVQTSSPPKVHRVQTNSSPKAQHVQTGSSPKAQHIQTSFSPKAQQHLQTSSSPKAHVQTSSSPKLQVSSQSKIPVPSVKKVPPPTKPKPLSRLPEMSVDSKMPKPTHVTKLFPAEADRPVNSISPQKSKREFRKNSSSNLISELANREQVKFSPEQTKKISPKQTKKFSPEQIKNVDSKQTRPVSIESPVPVLSLKNKFEKLAGADLQAQSPKLKPVQKSLLEKQKPEYHIEEDLPPPLFEDFESHRFSIISVDNDLPLPAEVLKEMNSHDNEEGNEEHSFLPPPLVPDDYTVEEDPSPNLQRDINFIPPPLFVDSDEDVDCVEDKTKISSPPPAFVHPVVDVKLDLPQNEKEDLLDSIVGNLIKLTRNNNESDESDTEESGSPPPLPSGPPPDSDEELGEEMLLPFGIDKETENENEWIDVLPNTIPTQQLSKHSFALLQNQSPAARDFPTNDAMYNLPPPATEDFLTDDVINLPPPAAEDFFTDDLLPPAVEDLLTDDVTNNLPPPAEEDFLTNDIPPPAAEDFLGDDLPPPAAEDFLRDDLSPPAAEDLLRDDLPPPAAEDFLRDDLPPLAAEDFHRDDLPPPVAEDFLTNDLLPPSFPDLSDEELDQDVEVLPVPTMDDSSEEFTDDTSPGNVLLPPPIFSEKKGITVEELESEELPAANSEVPVKLWSVDKVCDWLTEIGLSTYCQTFRDNEIVGEHLIDLSRDDLKDLGITKIGHIKTLTQKLQHELQK